MAQQDDGGSRISDEEWQRFGEQVGQGRSDAPQEPSARARMVTERLRREDEERRKAAGRFGRKGKAAAAAPPGWRTGPAWQEREGRGRGKRRLKAAAAIVFVAGLALIALRPELLIDRVTGKAESRQEAERGGPLAAESARPTGAPEVAYPDRPTPKDPFRGSPALQWADGAAGIEVPPAEAVNGVDKDRIADGLAKAKQFLVAANLDPAVLRGERPVAALALLDPKDDVTHRRMRTAYERPTEEADPLELFTRYDPAELRPVGDVVKVRGRMWLEAGPERGQAAIKVDYSFVHPFVKVKGNPEDVARSIVRREMTFHVVDAKAWESTAGTLWIHENLRDVANTACDRYDGYLHPSFFSDPTESGPEPSGAAVDPYDRSRGIDTSGQEECGTLSRS
ncbi:hypothetical protein [Streptomyces sp. NPDC001568]|uniref:hypothetical protein n=1 Tax=Streptomyces sp. NPDC001568 TaxID=3364588 RepID=UPI003698AC0B